MPRGVGGDALQVVHGAGERHGLRRTFGIAVPDPDRGAGLVIDEDEPAVGESRGARELLRPICPRGSARGGGEEDAENGEEGPGRPAEGDANRSGEHGDHPARNHTRRDFKSRLVR